MTPDTTDLLLFQRAPAEWRRQAAPRIAGLWRARGIETCAGEWRRCGRELQRLVWAELTADEQAVLRKALAMEDAAAPPRDLFDTVTP